MILVQLLKLLGFVCISTKCGQLLWAIILKVWHCMLSELWQCVLGTQPAVLHRDTCSVNLSFYFYVCPLPRRRQCTPVLLPGKSHGWSSLVGYSPWGREESDTTERLHFLFSLPRVGERNGNPLQYSCLENPRDRGAWWAAVYGVAQSRTQLMWLSSSSSSPLLGPINLFLHLPSWLGWGWCCREKPKEPFSQGTVWNMNVGPEVLDFTFEVKNHGNMDCYSWPHLSLKLLRQRELWVHLYLFSSTHMGFPDDSVIKYLPSDAGDMSFIPGLGRSPGGGNGNSLQYSCLENPMDRGVWRATVQGGHKQLDVTEHSTHTPIPLSWCFSYQQSHKLPGSHH